MNTKEIVVKNYRRSRKWGWGWSTVPTGKGLGIEPPQHPDYVGTLNQLDKARQEDEVFHNLGGAFYNTAWFYDGQRIVATLAFDVVERPEECNLAIGEYYERCKWGWTWVDGCQLPPDKKNVKIRVEEA